MEAWWGVPDPENPFQVPYLQAAEAAASSFGIQFSRAAVRSAAEIECAIVAFAQEPRGALIVLPSVPAVIHRDLIIALAARHRLPAVYALRVFVEAGGLLSYGVDEIGIFRQAASYVDRILRGAQPADLPVQTPVKYETVVNLKTAKALGLNVPPGMLVAADEVIE
jgi:putative tryptophan/tyrosine transport system substrate-binding protein